MPLYDYICRGCEHGFEALVRGGVEPACPGCGGRDLERLPPLAGVQGDGTRARSLRAAQRRDAAQARERMHERLKYEQSHDRHG